MKNSIWSSAAQTADSYALFRGRFRLAAPGRVEFRVVGAAWYQAWLDGRPLVEGPLRFALDRPEYQIAAVELDAGDHWVAFHAHHIGAETRLLKDTPPFVWCEILAGESPLPVDWRCLALESQGSRTHRINPQLGWIEWRDTRLEPEDWAAPGFDDSGWTAPISDASDLPDPVAADLAPVQTVSHALQPIAEGPLATTFGYAADEPALIFHLRDRVCRELPATGIWRRYDLGRVRLGRPSFRLDVPAGTIVEIGFAEYLTEGRVSPYINLSAGTSCNMDRFVARGGEQVFCPLTPKGGRFLEVHVVDVREGVRFLDERFLERAYHVPTGASLSCDDPLLEKIWSVGIETYRACAEDALIDNPTRERGQWVGDVASVGMAIASVAYHDLRLCRRALVQSALCPREDGLVAGMSPGGCAYLPTYAFQWVVAVQDYVRHTGDRCVLAELWDPALVNMQAIRAHWSADGLRSDLGWNFVDWGYRVEDGPVDTACNLHYLGALRGMAEWARALGRDASEWDAQAGELSLLLQQRLTAKLESGGWPSVGYHCAALAMRLGLVSEEDDCLAFLARHWESCFPVEPSAPRNDDPTRFNTRLITPYFSHYLMPLFIERGKMDFVLRQFRECWGGFMLENNRTTWLEVFDTRWSHCHQWSGCPTWQLSRYLLGLHPRFDLGESHFDFRFEPGSLTRISGRLPHHCGGWIEISSRRDDTGWRVRISTPEPVHLRMPDGEIITVEKDREIAVPTMSSRRTRRLQPAGV
jgi:hypothetical protein